MDINYRSGLDKVRPLASSASWYVDFLTYEARLLDSLSAYEKHGDTQRLAIISQVVEQLNILILKHLKKSFNEFCEEEDMSGQADVLPKQAPSLMQPSPIFNPDPRVSLFPKKMRRWAVLVGVNVYEDQNHYGYLQYCADDVKKLRDILLAGGFEEDTLQVLSDQEKYLPRREFIIPVLQNIADHTEPEDLLLFYFGGHGLAQDGESYLIPSNAFGLSLQDVAIRVSRVKEIIEKAKAGKKVLIFDACHSGTLKGVRGNTGFMSAEFIKNICHNARGLAILSSCDQDERSYDWPEQKCGVYTYYLLEALAGKAAVNGQITVQNVSLYVNHHVKQWAYQHFVVQTPILNYFVDGEIDLVEYHPQENVDDVSGDTPIQPPAEKLEEEEMVATNSTDVAKEAGQSILYWQKLGLDIQKLFDHDQDMWSSNLQILIRDFHAKPWRLALDGNHMQLINEKTKEIVIHVNYLHSQMKDLINHLQRFCAIEHPGKLSQEKKSILDKLNTLRPEILKVQDELFFLISLADSEEEDQQQASHLSLASLERYVSDIHALRDGNVHANVKKRLQEKGVRANQAERNMVEDILARYLQVPLHAVFLYTTEDRAVENYILKNWQALASLSGDNCDIYISVAQFNGAENGYDNMNKLNVIKLAGFDDYAQLPGLFFWDRQGATAYIPIGPDGKQETITYILRVVFREIKKEASLASIMRARLLLEL